MVVFLLSLLLFLQSKVMAGNLREDDIEEGWQQCSVFLAPSTTGWGVFAARPFALGEIVEIAPLVLAVESSQPVVANSVLDDYVYTYWGSHFWYSVQKNTRRKVLTLNAVVLGMSQIFNHHTEANVMFATFSREPAVDAPNAITAMGFIATRSIEAGEELFTTYNKLDEGKSWFQRRGIDIHLLPKEQTRIPQSDLARRANEYCSHSYAGFGRTAWERGVLSVIPKGKEVTFWKDIAQFAPKNGCLGSAFAKHGISKGSRIEIAPALVMSRSMVENTLIAPLVVRWEDISPQSKHTLKQLRENEQLVLQYQGEDTAGQRVDRFHAFEDIVLFPVAGTIGMVRRVGPSNESSNCRLEIRSNVDSGSMCKQ